MSNKSYRYLGAKNCISGVKVLLLALQSSRFNFENTVTLSNLGKQLLSCECVAERPMAVQQHYSRASVILIQ